LQDKFYSNFTLEGQKPETSIHATYITLLIVEVHVARAMRILLCIYKILHGIKIKLYYGTVYK